MKNESKTAVSAGSGAVVGSVLAVKAVSVGAMAGTAGGAAFTSGLATVGGVIGGGMGAGICVVAAAPILGGLAGAGLYRLWRRVRGE